jgi:hypothetical protein
MSGQVVIYRVCDKCSGEVAATVTDKLSLNGHRYEVDLCDEHSTALHAAVLAWAELGKKTGSPSRWDVARTHTGEIRGGATPAPTRTRTPEPVEQPARLVEELPASAARWRLSEHAEQRMTERGFTRREVLMAAERPEVVMPPDDRGGREQKWGRCLVVVSVDAPVILTVKVAGQLVGDAPVTQSA